MWYFSYIRVINNMTMNKPLLFFFVLMLGMKQLSFAQPLAAHAGQFVTVCSNYPDTFRLGGIPSATGGMAPYTYEWTLKNMPSLTAAYFVDSIDTDNPLIKNSNNKDSA